MTYREVSPEGKRGFILPTGAEKVTENNFESVAAISKENSSFLLYDIATPHSVMREKHFLANHDALNRTHLVYSDQAFFLVCFLK